MSIKDLFEDKTKNQVTNESTLASASADVESYELVKAKTFKKNEFVPPTDFSTASNFAKYGSAELYYEYGFKRIYESYPYDGTLAEKISFENSSSYLDKYIFDEIYPRTNGYITFNYQGFDGSKIGSFHSPTTKEYIKLYGGPHTASSGMTGQTLHSTFDESTLYDPANSRESNLKIDYSKGATIEFWFKKSGYHTSLASKEVIFDLWNQKAEGDADYSRLFLLLTNANNFKLAWHSGSTSDIQIINNSFAIADGKWHHYAVTLKNDGTNMNCNFYIDGNFNRKITSTNLVNSLSETTKGLMATLGSFSTGSSLPAGGTPPEHKNLQLGDGKLSASMDEFRFWKTERDAKQIGYNWFTQVGGGTDDYTYNTDLGVYYKFNEGITTDAATDAAVLDYSGRLTNGNWVGYASGARNVNSAIVLAGAAEKEFKDPIIYSYHPDVASIITSYKATGSQVDYENPSLFHHLLPSWLIEEDQQNGQNIRYLSQIMAGYFDTLHSQIEFFNKIKDERYSGALLVTGAIAPDSILQLSGGTKPLPFARNLLRGRGFVMPNLFVETNIVEEFLDQDNNEVYETDVAEVKNKIYQNIYNNLLYIYKSKGTEKSFRNFIRAFGVDSSLIKLNMYADGATYTFKNNYEFKSVPTRTVNFNHPSNFEASVFQNTGSDGSKRELEDIASVDAEFSAFTAECEVIFPKKLEISDTGFFSTSFITSSIFGLHRVVGGGDDTFHSDEKNIQVYIVKDEPESPNAYFLVTGSDSIYLTSSRFANLYDNNKWNLTLRYKHSKYPLMSLTGGQTGGNHNLEFYAVNSNGNTKLNSFKLSQNVVSADSEMLLTKNKKFYVGAHKTNFTGSYTQRSDVKISHLRYWQSSLPDETIDEHSYDVENYGVDNPYSSDAPLFINNVHVPKHETMALHWDFSINTGSNASGQFDVVDISSGSLSDRYGWIGAVTKEKYNGLGHNFIASSNKAIDKEFIFSAKRRNPYDTFSSDMVNIVKGDPNEVFFEDDEVSDNFYSLEKSMQAVISDEMINMFGVLTDFNNLIGDPVYRYRSEYKELNHLRRLFFEKVENEPDQERFFEFYKWIDSSISYGIKQLFPASARFSDGVANVIESHLLEKNKYQHKFPLIAQEVSTEGSVKSIGELSYDWKFGHAPPNAIPGASPAQNKHYLWQHKRRKMTSLDGPSLDVLQRAEVLRVVRNRTAAGQIKLIKVLKSGAGTAYLSNQPIDLSVYKSEFKLKHTIHGGVNYPPGKNRNFVYEATYPHGPVNAANLPLNTMTVGLGVGDGIVSPVVVEDALPPGVKTKIAFVGEHARKLDDTYAGSLKGHHRFPFNLFTSSLAPSTGYLATVANHYRSASILTNLHSDTVDLTNEIPMQGPFTETHVGGHQSRHVPINKYDIKVNSLGNTRANNIDDKFSRPEAWQLAFGVKPDPAGALGVDPGGKALGMIGADYGGPYPYPGFYRATRFREETAKRPVSIRNIQHDTGSNRAGNYNRNYEILSGFVGGSSRIRNLVKNPQAMGTRPSYLADNSHTMPVSLMGEKPGSRGNTFSVFEDSNRFHSEITSSVDYSTGSASKSIIRSKFSSPGGPEVQSPLYLDIYSQQHSAYNALPWRNYSVRSSGSGESGSMWAVQSHAGRREGHRTLLRRHMGRFGVDSVHGTGGVDLSYPGVLSTDVYVSEPSFQKQHRNSSYTKFQDPWTETVIDIPFSAPAFASASFYMSGAIYTGSFASGAFEVTGMMVPGAGGHGSFKVLGVPIPGTQATGSFRISGSTLNSSASGSFDVTGAYGQGYPSMGSFVVTGVHLSAETSSVKFRMKQPQSGRRLENKYYVFDIGSHAYDGDWVKIEDQYFDIETGNSYGHQSQPLPLGPAAADWNTFHRLNYYNAGYFHNVVNSFLTSSQSDQWNSSYLPVTESMGFWLSSWCAGPENEMAGTDTRKDFIIFGSGSANDGSGHSWSSGTGSLEVYFSGSDGDLYVRRYWWDHADSYRGHMSSAMWLAHTHSGYTAGQAIDQGANPENPNFWKLLQISANAQNDGLRWSVENEAFVKSGQFSDLSTVPAGHEAYYNPGSPVSFPNLADGPSPTKWEWVEINRVKKFMDPSYALRVDETAFWDVGIWSAFGAAPGASERLAVQNAIKNNNQRMMGADGVGTPVSGAALHALWTFGDVSGDNQTDTTADWKTKSQTGTGNPLRFDSDARALGAPSGWQGKMQQVQSKWWSSVKTDTEWFDHCRTVLTSALSLASSNAGYEVYSIDQYADFAGAWYLTSSMASGLPGQEATQSATMNTASFARFYVDYTADNSAADYFVHNSSSAVANVAPLTNTSSFLWVDAADSQNTSTDIHFSDGDTFVFSGSGATGFGIEVNHLDNPESIFYGSTNYEQLKTWTTKHPALWFKASSANYVALTGAYDGDGLWKGNLDSFLCSFYVKYIGGGSGHVFALYGDSASPAAANSPIRVKHNTSGQVIIYVRDGGTPADERTFTVDNLLTSETWAHIAVAYSGSTAGAGSQGISVWKNGQLVSIDSTSGTDAISLVGWDPEILFVGDPAVAAGTGEFQGAIADLAFWTGSFVTADIEKIYNNGRFYNLQAHPQGSKLLNWWLPFTGAASGPTEAALTARMGLALNVDYTFNDYGYLSNFPSSSMAGKLTCSLQAVDYTEIYVTGGIPNAATSNANFWDDFRDKFNTSQNSQTPPFGATYSATTYATFTVSSSQLADNNSYGLTRSDSSNGGWYDHTPYSWGGTDNKYLYLQDGADIEGALYNDAIWIGTKRFELTESGGSKVDAAAIGVKAGPYHAATFTNIDFWNDLTAAIETAGEFTVVTHSVDASNMRFDLTASETGSSLNGAITNQSQSFSSVVQLVGGAPYSGSYQGNSITIGGVEFKLFTGSSNPWSLPVHGISNTGSNADFWLKLTQSIAANTNFDVFNNSVGGNTLTVNLTSSARTASDNVTIARGPQVGAYNDFNNLVGTAGGGVFISGVQHSHSITIDGDKFQFYTGSSVPAGWPATSIQSTGSGATVSDRDTYFWTVLSQSITGNTIFTTATASAQGGNEAIFYLTASETGSVHNVAFTLDPPGNSSFIYTLGAAGGTSGVGAIDGNSVEIDGKTFEFDISPAGVAGSNVTVTASQATDQLFWQHFQNVILEETSFDTINRVAFADYSLFQLTCSIPGTNPVIGSPTGSTVYGITSSAGAFLDSGAVPGHQIQIDGIWFEIVTGSSGFSDGTASVDPLAASDMAFWLKLTESITTYTNFSCSHIDNFQPTKARIYFTASVVGSARNQNFDFNPTGGANTTFSNLPAPHNPNGGTDPSGSVDGDSIRIAGKTFEIVSGSEAPSGTNTAITGGWPGKSSIQMWNELSTSIGANTDYSSVKYTQIGSDAFYELTYSVTGPMVGNIDNVSPNSFRAPLWHEGADDIDEVSHLVDHAGVYRTLHDNAFVNTPIPRSDFQYSWIQKACGTGRDTDFAEQIITGYAPVDGLASGSSGIQEAIVFPGSSGDLDCIGCWNGVYAFGSLHQTYECGGGEIDLGTLITFDHPLGIDSPYPIANVRGLPDGITFGETGSYTIDYTASYGGGAGVLYRTVEFVIQDTIPPNLNTTNRLIFADANGGGGYSVSPQISYPMSNAASWWQPISTMAPDAKGSDGSGILTNMARLDATEACGTVTWTSGAFGTIPITGSGYVPDTYAVSFTASDSNGLSSDDEFDLVIQLQTPLGNTTLHGPSQTIVTPATAPFASCGPTFPGFQIPCKPIYSEGYSFDISLTLITNQLEIDSNGHAWYPIPSASWWDPAAHPAASDAPASNLVIGIDKNHVTDPRPIIDGYDDSGTSAWTVNGGNTITARDGYLLAYISGSYDAIIMGTPTTVTFLSGAVERTGAIGWEVVLRGTTYQMTASYTVSDGNDSVPSGDTL